MNSLRKRFVLSSREIGPLLKKRYYHELSFLEPGNPADVLEYHQSYSDVPEGSLPAVRVEIHHVPWNPADINTVQGKYPSPYPADQEPASYPSYINSARKVAGSEGYGRVVEINGDKSEALQIGDWVTFGRAGLGTLRSSLWLDSQEVIPIRRGEEIFGRNENAAEVSSLFQLAGTALGLLRGFVNLREGDTVIQNAGNSGVGVVVSQLAKNFVDEGVQMVSVVRRGDKTPEQFNEMADYLKTVGKADVVLAQEDWIDNRKAYRELVNEWNSPPVLALNAVGGSSSNFLLSLLGQGGTHVTYGGMSMRPVTVSTSQLIFKDLHVHGYWQSRWMVRHSYSEKVELMNEIADGYLAGLVQPPPVKVFPLSGVNEAFEYAAQQSNETIRKKLVFDCRET